MDWFRRFSLGETKRTVYFWGMVLAAPSFLLVLLLQSPDPYIRYAYPAMMGLCVLWAAMLWYRWPIETIERSAIVGVGLLFGGKFVYSLLFAPNLAAQWREVESSYWAISYVILLIFIAFSPKRAVGLSVMIFGFTVLVGLARFLPDLPQGSLRAEWLDFVRSEIRLAAMMGLLYILSTVKDRLLVANQQAERLEVLARTDVLTGLPNRLALSEHLEEAISTPHDLYVVLMDIDHFKNINDQYGHAAGDRVLQEVAKRLRERMRKNDVLGRWGGEELLVLMRGDNTEDIVQAVERLREEIALWPFVTVGMVSASFGIAQGMEGDNPHTLLNRADMALYRAKHSGRNRVEI